MRFTLNGKRARRRRASDEAAARRAARGLRADRHEGRLRRRRVRRVHRAHRRRAGELVPRAVRAGRTARASRRSKGSADDHPLQRAFIEDGGAQCGICTPGHDHGRRGARAAGRRSTTMRDGARRQLCRCTGYAAIYRSIRARARTRSSADAAIGRSPPSCSSRASLDEALRMLRDEGPLVPMAGCTDLYVALNFGTLDGDAVPRTSGRSTSCAASTCAATCCRSARSRPTPSIIGSPLVQTRLPMLVGRGARDRRRADPESRHARRQHRERARRPATRCRCWPPPTRWSCCGARPASGACRSRRSTPAIARPCCGPTS